MTASSCPSPLTTQQMPVRQRINSIDMLRGLVMLIMLLDHVRERVLLHLQVSDPMDIASTEAGLFFSRLAAHLCAPVFIFLTGLSAWLYQHQSPVPRDVRQFLIKRGLFLILLELTLVNFAWMGAYHTLWLQVIWVIGLCMLALALLSVLPRTLLWLIALTLLFGHNLLTPISFLPGEWGYSLWTLLHDRNYLVSEGALKVKVSYPLLPWIGVIVLGYLTGPLFSKLTDPQQRQRILLRAGVAALLLFVLLRGFNLYGETLPWQAQPTLVLTVMDIFNVTKYPPSLNFLLLTLGLMCLLLCWFERPMPAVVRRVFADFGAAPMFFYLLHLYVLLLIYQLLLWQFGANHGSLYGVPDIRWVWLMSLMLALLLYPPTRWFAAFKKRSSWRWIRYF
ncbi:DUF1624 domain-containing protein [Rheinheimera riviphila]|uniref:DUF1624 domain-containing protein n=1 Tax=Rheinheimera riviphila TaxID=1834037 RepID=A0A437R5B6_9GAMM|nr:heparan-alpha-glucosaminide N-acetyltransferase domain-containing protein [Rheinheimera riviphila]RVU41978.1 DUF1624 domain-containing protein [Rheinheimera riviphila]